MTILYRKKKRNPGSTSTFYIFFTWSVTSMTERFLVKKRQSNTTDGHTSMQIHRVVSPLSHTNSVTTTA